MREADVRFSRLVFFVLFLGLALGSFGCSKAGFQTSDIYRRGAEDAVMLVWETDEDGAVLPGAYNHPVTIDEEKVRTALSKLTYSEHIFFKWREKGSVFYEDEIDKIAPPIVRALSKATKDQWASFEVTSYKRDLLFKSKRLSSGWVWHEAGKLHLVMGNFRLELSHESEPFKGDPRTRFRLGTNRIDPGPFHAVPPVVPEDPFLKKNHHNWVVIDLAAVPEKKEDPVAVRRSAEERLEELNRLLEKGLITQEEFDQKRKVILEEL